MAVSGRKRSDLLGSVATGSEEDFDHCCEPCLTTGQRIDFHGFCGTCQEYLCDICLDCHRKAKVSRNHNIISKNELEKFHTKQQSYNDCTEQCSVHKKEIIKFYCQYHSAFGCNDCMTLGHRTCNIDYIPDTCATIAGGKQFDDVMQKLSGKLKEAEKTSQKAKERSIDIDDCSKEIIKAITEFRKEINDRLDQMQQEVLRNAEAIKTKNNRIVQKVLDECASMISDIKRLQSKLNVSKSNHQNSQLYIDMKRAESTLKSDELSDAEQTLTNTNMQSSFQPNSDLETVLSKTMVFGEIVSHSGHESTNEIKYVHRLAWKKDINVQTLSDNRDCYITGCAVLNTNKLILADRNNKKVKWVCTENKLVKEEKVLESYLWDIAVISQDQFAVTMPEIKEIADMITDDKLSCVRSIKLKWKCYGIDFNHDRFYVACLSPSSVIVLDTHGDILNSIPLNFLSQYLIPYITVRKDSKLMYISDNGNDTVVSVSLQGEVTATYKHNDLIKPREILMLYDGSLLVCCSGNGTIHKVGKDFKQRSIIRQDLEYPSSVCYNTYFDEVFVGGDSNQFKVLSAKLPMQLSLGRKIVTKYVL